MTFSPMLELLFAILLYTVIILDLLLDVHLPVSLDTSSTHHAHLEFPEGIDIGSLLVKFSFTSL